MASQKYTYKRTKKEACDLNIKVCYKLNLIKTLDEE